MTEMQRYLAEEVAEDLADGIITRREALQRLGLMGITGAAASGLLASFAAPVAVAEGAARGQARGRGHATTWEPVATEEITFAGPAGTLMAAWAPAERARGGVLVIHENRGLDRPHPQRRRPLRGDRLVGARARPAVAGGRDGGGRRRRRGGGRS